MKKKTRTALIIATSILVALAALIILGLAKYGPMFGIYLSKPSPQTYAAQAIRLMESGIYTDKEAWPLAKENAQEAIEKAETYADTYETLKKLLKVAGGKHSFLMLPEINKGEGEGEEKGTGEGKEAATIALPEARREGNILILSLPAFSGTAEEATLYAETALKALKGTPKPDGVIVDLRGNTGGDMNPMLTAIAPLVPDGTLFSFGMRQLTIPVTVSGLTISTGGARVSIEPFKLSDLRVAVLTDENTASSGEATLLALRGLPNVKTFGAPTAGYCSGNVPIKLFDGATLVITTSTDISRSGEVFCEDPIVPDSLSDTPLEAALAWLK